MHEMSLAEGVLQAIADSARANRFARVRRVWLEIGELAGVEPEALRFCFDAVTRGSMAEGAALDIVSTPGTAWCMDCARTVALPALDAACPGCGGWLLQVNGGRELRVKELEVE
jgi:hydrogenase nickel incorporation protein HypA/HybF